MTTINLQTKEYKSVISPDLVDTMKGVITAISDTEITVSSSDGTTGLKTDSSSNYRVGQTILFQKDGIIIKQIDEDAGVPTYYV